MRLEDLGIIGNCQVAALVDRRGDLVWCCLPRFDSEPVFGALLDEKDGGHFLAGPAGGEAGTQRYLPNTNVLETTFTTPEGSFRILDLAPRFLQYDRIFRPTQILRILEPLSGTPRARVVCDPRLGWTKAKPSRLQGSNHFHYEGFANPLRLTSDIPPTYLEGAPFALTQRRHLVLSWGAPVEEALTPLCDRFLYETVRHWRGWVKQCDIPFQFQGEVIRSALALKLHCFEDTGAIVASITTSIPESSGSGRTWDYRYCWLRDAYQVVAAFHLLGHFDEREAFLNYLLTVVGSAPSLDLLPLYRMDGTADLEERILAGWPGFNGEGPVRVGNAAAKHRQNDIYGEMVLALAPIFLDERFREERSGEVLKLLTRLTEKAIAVAGTADAGIWEYRREWRVETFSTVMCWAAADRMAAVAERALQGRAAEFRAAAERLRGEVLAKAWNPAINSFASTHGGSDLDAALLQLPFLRFLPKDDPRLAATVDAICRDLNQEGWLMRYRTDDGLGKPAVAFTLCVFWLVEALAALGRRELAREVMARAGAARSPLGLLSEDYDPAGKRMWGNFPQAYSHVGLIRAAFAASPPWAEIL